MKKTETSKKFAFFLIGLFTALIIISVIMVWKFKNAESNATFASSVIGNLVTYGIYCRKAFKSKQSEEYLKYQKEQLLQNKESSNED